MVGGKNVWKLLSDEYGNYNVCIWYLFSHDYETLSFFPVDGWLMFDGLRFICFFNVTSNAWKLFSIEVQNDYGDYSEIRDSRVQPVTRFSMQHTFSSLMFRRRSVYYPHVSFICVLRGTQRTPTGVQPLVPRYWPGY